MGNKAAGDPNNIQGQLDTETGILQLPNITNLCTIQRTLSRMARRAITDSLIHSRVNGMGRQQQLQQRQNQQRQQLQQVPLPESAPTDNVESPAKRQKQGNDAVPATPSPSRPQVQHQFSNICRFLGKDTIDETDLPRLEALQAELVAVLMVDGKIEYIKKIMNNVEYIFDSFAELLTRGKRIGCKLTDNQIVDKCNKYEHLFLLWDGAFSVARTNNPQKKDIDEFTYFINAAFECHKRIGCSITPKVHLMKAHCAWQMANLEGGLGDKGEDWVEQKHQDMAKLMRQYRNVKNPQQRAIAIERAQQRNKNPLVLKHAVKVYEKSQRKFKDSRLLTSEKNKMNRRKNRLNALHAYYLSDTDTETSTRVVQYVVGELAALGMTFSRELEELHCDEIGDVEMTGC